MVRGDQAGKQATGLGPSPCLFGTPHTCGQRWSRGQLSGHMCQACISHSRITYMLSPPWNRPCVELRRQPGRGSPALWEAAGVEAAQVGPGALPAPNQGRSPGGTWSADSLQAQSMEGTELLGQPSWAWVRSEAGRAEACAATAPAWPGHSLAGSR